MPAEKFLHIDTTDKIMGIPVKHLSIGAGTAVFTSFVISEISTSPLALFLVPLSGYVAYRISYALEKRFPGTSFYYYRKWFSMPQVLLPGPDWQSIPVVWRGEEGSEELFGERKDLSATEAL